MSPNPHGPTKSLDTRTRFQKLHDMVAMGTPAEQAVAQEKLDRLKDRDLTADDILHVDDTRYGERESEYLERVLHTK